MLGKEFKIAFANIKQKKSVTISIIILIFLVSLFLNICFSLITIPKVVNELHEELNGCDLRILIDERYDKEADTLEKFTKVDGVAEVECIKTINMGLAMVMEENKHNMEGKEILKSCEQKDDSKYGICVPIAMESVGYSLGDTYVLKEILTGYTVTCEITGFARYPSMFSSDTLMSVDNFRADMNSEDFNRLLEASRKNTKETRFTNVENCYLLKYNDNAVENDIVKAAAKAINKEPGDMDYSRYSLVRDNTVFNLSLYSGIMMIFSVLVLAVAGFMVLFKMNDSIHSDMKSIGALGAMGYSCNEIRRAYALQYVIYAVVGTFAGLLVSYAVTPLLHDIVLKIACVSNPYILHFTADIATALVIFTVIFIILFISTRKFKKYPPVVALNDGLQSHSFKKNHAPIEKTKGSLSAIFAFKNIMREKRQMVLVIISVMLLTLSTTTLMDIKQNLELDDFWCYILGFEKPVATVIVKRENYESVKSDVKSIEGVDRVIGTVYSYLDCNEDDENTVISFIAMEDFSDSKYLNCYSGERPVRDNEVALSESMAKRLSKKVGDRITLSHKNKDDIVKSGEYLITGLTQNANSYNFITIDGMKKTDSDNQFHQLFVYSETLGFKQIEDKLIDMCGEVNIDAKIFVIDNMEEMIEENIETYRVPMTAITYIMMGITFLVILFILAVVIRSALYNMKRELGVRKALGFNSREIIVSIMLTYLPIVAIGAFLGAAALILTMPPLTKLLFDGILEVHNMKLVIYPDIIFPFAGVIVLFALLITLLFSLKVKRITPRELVSE